MTNLLFMCMIINLLLAITNAAINPFNSSVVALNLVCATLCYIGWSIRKEE